MIRAAIKKVLLVRWNIEYRYVVSMLKTHVICLAELAYVATQILTISGSEVARRFSVDRTAISRATLRVSRDRNCLQPPKRYKENSNSKRINIETTYLSIAYSQLKTKTFGKLLSSFLTFFFYLSCICLFNVLSNLKMIICLNFMLVEIFETENILTLFQIMLLT